MFPTFIVKEGKALQRISKHCSKQHVFWAIKIKGILIGSCILLFQELKPNSEKPLGSAWTATWQCYGIQLSPESLLPHAYIPLEPKHPAGLLKEMGERHPHTLEVCSCYPLSTSSAQEKRIWIRLKISSLFSFKNNCEKLLKVLFQFCMCL